MQSSVSAVGISIKLGIWIKCFGACKLDILCLVRPTSYSRECLIHKGAKNAQKVTATQKWGPRIVPVKLQTSKRIYISCKENVIPADKNFMFYIIKNGKPLNVSFMYTLMRKSIIGVFLTHADLKSCPLRELTLNVKQKILYPSAYKGSKNRQTLLMAVSC